MSEFELEGLLGLDASDYVSGADDATAASDDLVRSAGETSESLLDIDPAGIAAGGALAGVGTAMQSVLDETQELNETLGRTSVGMGLTTDETRDLATSLSDASFPVDDVVGSMDALAQIGVDTEEEMRSVAIAADNLADATGTSATQISEGLAPAVMAMDGDLSALEDDADAFTNAVRNTGLEMSDLSSTIERLDFTQMEEMGLSAADTAELIGKFGEESGFTGRQLRSNFGQAVEAADGDVNELVTELGLGEDAMASLADETAAGSSMTDQYANAANESLTTMDTLRSSFADIRLEASGMLGPLDAATPAMQGLGIAAIALSTINFGAVIPSIAGVVAAATPLLPILLPIAAVLGGMGVAWPKGWIDPVETATWVAESAGDMIGWLTGRLGDATDAVMRFYPPIRAAREVWDRNLFGIQDTTSNALGVVGDTIDWLVDKINAIPGVNIGSDDVELDEPAVESSGELAGESYAGGFEAGLGSTLDDYTVGASTSTAIEGPIEAEMTPAVRAALEDGVDGYISDPDQIEDGPTEINEDLFNAVAEQPGGASADTLGVSEMEFDALMDRFDGRSESRSSGGSPGRSSQRQSESNGGSNKIIEELRSLRELFDGGLGLLIEDGQIKTADGHIVEIVDARLERVGDREARNS